MLYDVIPSSLLFATRAERGVPRAMQLKLLAAVWPLRTRLLHVDSWERSILVVAVHATSYKSSRRAIWGVVVDKKRWSGDGKGGKWK